MENPNNHQPSKWVIKKFTRLKRYLVIFCLGVLAFSYIELGKTNVPATQEEIAALKAAAKVDKRPEISEKLENELNMNPNPKVWQLNNMKEKLGLTYIDKERSKEETK
jgi:hypothetical protein